MTGTGSHHSRGFKVPQLSDRLYKNTVLQGPCPTLRLLPQSRPTANALIWVRSIRSGKTRTLPAAPGKGRARPPVQIGRITRPKSGRFSQLSHCIKVTPAVTRDAGLSGACGNAPLPMQKSMSLGRSNKQRVCRQAWSTIRCRPAVAQGNCSDLCAGCTSSPAVPGQKVVR